MTDAFEPSLIDPREGRQGESTEKGLGPMANSNHTSFFKACYAKILRINSRVLSILFSNKGKANCRRQSRSNCTPYNPQWVENTVAESKVLASVLGESC